MIKPWLIARCYFRNESIHYDYMGSSEFEFGNPQKSLRRLFAGERVTHELTVSATNSKKITIFVVTAKAFEFDLYKDNFQMLAQNKLSLQEPSYFDDAVENAASVLPKYFRHMLFDLWQDIEHDLLFTIGEDNKQKLEKTLEQLQAIYKARDEEKR